MLPKNSCTDAQSIFMVMIYMIKYGDRGGVLLVHGMAKALIDAKLNSLAP